MRPSQQWWGSWELSYVTQARDYLGYAAMLCVDAEAGRSVWNSTHSGFLVVLLLEKMSQLPYSCSRLCFSFPAGCLSSSPVGYIDEDPVASSQ